MPRISKGEKLEKVVSSNISASDFMLLKKYARIRYNQNKLPQPTISHLLRAIIKGWARARKKEEEQPRSPTPNS